MAEPLRLLAHALWIGGLAMLLASWGDRSWQGFYRDTVRARVVLLPARAGYVLFCVGMAGVSTALWARLLWLALAVGALALRDGR